MLKKVNHKQCLNLLELMRLLSLVLSLLIFFQLALPLQAQTESDSRFATNYNISYEVLADGMTQVTEDVTVRNLSDQYFASSITINISATDIQDVKASDKSGPLPIKVDNIGSKSQITVTFPQQIIGQDKVYQWKLSFKSKDFSQLQSPSIWQVSIPRIPTPASEDTYNVTLIVPVSFGDPSSINPTPTTQVERGGKLQMSFSADQLKDNGVVANFGQEQLLNFKLTYDLNNPWLWSNTLQIPIPMDNDYQQITINQISPTPSNVVIDNDNNYLAEFQLDRQSQQTVTVEGVATLKLTPQNYSPKLSETEINNYLRSQPFWESDNPVIKNRVNQILNHQNDLTLEQKAKIIYNEVVASLSFNNQRLADQDFKRLGAVTAINNPDQALSSEFVDSLVAMWRAADIPARRVDGYGISNNHQVRPTGLANGLHTWAEYYDPNLGWIAVDPTWSSTNGRIDYFTDFDLNHLAIYRSGLHSKTMILPSNIEWNYQTEPMMINSGASIELHSANNGVGGLPQTAQLVLHNHGNSALVSQKAGFNSEVVNLQDFWVPVIPPGGHVEAQVSLHAPFLANGPRSVEVIYADQRLSRTVDYIPFYQHPLIWLLIIIGPIIMVILYVLSFGIHLKTRRLIKLK